MCSVLIISVCRLICKFAALGNLPEQHPSHILHRFCGQLSFRVRGKSERYEIPIEDENLAKALRSLPPQKRSIVLLALFLGKTDKEIGQELSLPRTTVRDRRHEALKRLREMLGDEP